MALAPNAENYALGRGKLYFNRYDTDGVTLTGERALGNAPAFTFSMNVTNLDHYSSMAGLKTKDKSVVTQVVPTVKFTLDEVNTDNFVMLFLGNSSTVTQTLDTSQTDTLTSVQKGFWYNVTERAIGSQKLSIGAVTSGPFVVGETITQATSSATAVVSYVGSGYLLIVHASGTWDNSHVVTGGTSNATCTPSSGTTPFDASAVLVTNTGGSTVYVNGTDYQFESATGRIYIMGDSTIAASSNIKVDYVGNALTYTKVVGLSQTSFEGFMRFVSANPEGQNHEVVFWRVKLTPTGDTAFIGDAWSTIAFDGEVLADTTYHPTTPYLEMYSLD